MVRSLGVAFGCSVGVVACLLSELPHLRIRGQFPVTQTSRQILSLEKFAGELPPDSVGSVISLCHSDKRVLSCVFCKQITVVRVSGSVEDLFTACFLPSPAARDGKAEVQRHFLASAPSLDHGKVKVCCPAQRIRALSRVGKREASVSQSEISAKSQPWRGEQARRRKHRGEKEQASSGITMFMKPVGSSDRRGVTLVGASVQSKRLERHPCGAATRIAAAERNVEALLSLHRLSHANAFGGCPEWIANQRGGRRPPKERSQRSSHFQFEKAVFDQYWSNGEFKPNQTRSSLKDSTLIHRSATVPPCP